MYNYIFCFYSRLCIHQDGNIGVCINFILCKICSYILHPDGSFILFLIIKCVTKSIIFRRRKIVKEVFCSCRYLICEKPNEIDFPSKKKSPPFPYLSLAHTSENFDFYPNSNLASFHFKLILLYRAIFCNCI